MPGGSLRQAAILILLAYLCLSCAGSGIQDDQTQEPLVKSFSPSKSSTAPESGEVAEEPYTNLDERYSFPGEIDPSKRYMFYLHGKIIEDQGIPAISPEFGEYQYQEILTALDSNGLVLISEIRAKDTNAGDYAGRVVKQVKHLLDSGVKPGSITVVGASKGAAISASISNMLSNPEVNYVLLGGCYQPMIDSWKEQGLSLYGNILSIYDFADDSAASCQELFDFSAGLGLGKHEEIVLRIGTGHGILYEALPEWVGPTMQWATRDH